MSAWGALGEPVREQLDPPECFECGDDCAVCDEDIAVEKWLDQEKDEGEI